MSGLRMRAAGTAAAIAAGGHNNRRSNRHNSGKRSNRGSRRRSDRRNSKRSSRRSSRRSCRHYSMRRNWHSNRCSTGYRCGYVCRCWRMRCNSLCITLQPHQLRLRLRKRPIDQLECQRLLNFCISAFQCCYHDSCWYHAGLRKVGVAGCWRWHQQFRPH